MKLSFGPSLSIFINLTKCSFLIAILQTDLWVPWTECQKLFAEVAMKNLQNTIIVKSKFWPINCCTFLQLFLDVPEL